MNNFGCSKLFGALLFSSLLLFFSLCNPVAAYICTYQHMCTHMQHAHTRTHCSHFAHTRARVLTSLGHTHVQHSDTCTHTVHISHPTHSAAYKPTYSLLHTHIYTQHIIHMLHTHTHTHTHTCTLTHVYTNKHKQHTIHAVA